MNLVFQTNYARRSAAEALVVDAPVARGLVSQSALPAGFATVVIRPDDDLIKAEPVQERCRIMGDLFTGLTQAVKLGAQVDISDPNRIVISKPSN